MILEQILREKGGQVYSVAEFSHAQGGGRAARRPQGRRDGDPQRGRRADRRDLGA